jgi:hypothetical protein
MAIRLADAASAVNDRARMRTNPHNAGKYLPPPLSSIPLFLSGDKLRAENLLLLLNALLQFLR